MKFVHPPIALVILSGVLIIFVLAGCNLGKAASTPPPEAAVTQAYQTVQARVTQMLALTPSITPVSKSSQPATTPESIPTTAPAPVTTTSVDPSATPAASNSCDKAAPGSPKIDITIDDDTVMQPGEKFTKKWRLVNDGTCTWNKNYHAVWWSGAKLGEILSVPFTGDVPPGESMDITVDMVAPDTADTYQSNWKLSNASGVLFGIGPNGDLPFWVKIVVSPSSTGTAQATETPSATPSTTPMATATSTLLATPSTLASGQDSLLPDQKLDLDTNQINPASDDDLAYQADASKNHWLAPQNGAALGVYGGSEPLVLACRNASMSAAPIAVESLSPGTYLCYKTSQGRLGWLRLDQFNSSDYSILIHFLTWNIQ